MEFKDIIAITGMPGLYELVSSKNNGMVVKSLEDGKSQFVSTRVQGISSLDNIAVYLKNEETTELKKVFRQMQAMEADSPLPDAKADMKAMKGYFKKILPDYDEEKVHASDMKKMVKWYHSLKQHNLIPAEEEEQAETTSETEEKNDAEEKS